MTSPSRELLEAAARALNASPRASMAEIAAAVGIGRTTLHRQFENRRALMDALTRFGLDVWRESIANAELDTALASDDPTTVRRALSDLVRSYCDNADIYGSVMTTFEYDDVPELQAEVEDLIASERRLIGHAQSLGVLRSDVPARWIGWAIFGLIVAHRDSVRYGDIGPRAATDLVMTTLMEGIQTT